MFVVYPRQWIVECTAKSMVIVKVNSNVYYIRFRCYQHCFIVEIFLSTDNIFAFKIVLFSYFCLDFAVL